MIPAGFMMTVWALLMPKALAASEKPMPLTQASLIASHVFLEIAWGCFVTDIPQLPTIQWQIHGFALQNFTMPQQCLDLGLRVVAKLSFQRLG
jgi:hypothetical protein